MINKTKILLGSAVIASAICTASAFSLDTGIEGSVSGFDGNYTVFLSGNLFPDTGTYAGLARIGQASQWVSPANTPMPNSGKWISPDINVVNTTLPGVDPNPAYFDFVIEFTTYVDQSIKLNFAADNTVKLFVNGSEKTSHPGSGIVGFQSVSPYTLDLDAGSQKVVFRVFNAAQATGNPAGLLVSSEAINLPDGGSTMAMFGLGLVAVGMVQRRFGK